MLGCQVNFRFRGEKSSLELILYQPVNSLSLSLLEQQSYRDGRLPHLTCLRSPFFIMYGWELINQFLIANYYFYCFGHFADLDFFSSDFVHIRAFCLFVLFAVGLFDVGHSSFGFLRSYFLHSAQQMSIGNVLQGTGFGGDYGSTLLAGLGDAKSKNQQV